MTVARVTCNGDVIEEGIVKEDEREVHRLSEGVLLLLPCTTAFGINRRLGPV